MLWLADHIYLTLRDMSGHAGTPEVTAQLMAKAVRILREAGGDDAGYYELHISKACLALARAQAELGRPDAAADALRQAISAAERHAAHDGRYAAPWLAAAHGTPTSPADGRALFATLLRALEEPDLAQLPGAQALRDALFARCP